MRPIDADKMILELCKFVVCRLGEIKASDIKKFIDNQPTVNDWIPCSERLPEYTDNYNVTVGIGSMLGYFEEVRTYRYEIFNGKNPYRKWIIPNNANEIVNVIAWQNLPTKYSESEDK